LSDTTSITYQKCPMCDSTSIESHMAVKDHSISQEIFDLWQCGDCAFVFTQNPPSPADCGRYYESEEYISHSNTKSTLRDHLYHRARDYMLERKWKIIQKHTSIKDGGSLLDMGSGTGYFLNHVTNKGWRAEGIEMSDTAREHGVNNFGIKAHQPDTLWEMDQKFDVITLWHVLEHLYDFHRYVARFKAILKDGGLLIIAVPNRQSKDADHYGSDWAAYDVPRHLWHFTPSDLDYIALKHDFQMIKKYAMPLDAFYVSMLSEQYQNGSPIVGGTVRGLASNLSAWNDPNRSSSVIYVLKK